jgi:signal transduction histidine kinase/DNA-binding response OmpR family regulator/HPt (histidine-containing phosphotransfer) domain-containing protein
MSVLGPFSVALNELLVVSIVGGDPLVYFVMVGCALIGLAYADVVGSFIMIALTTAVTAFFIFVLGVPLFGVQFTFYDELYNFLGMIIVFAIILMLGNSSISTLVSFRKTGQTFDKILETSPSLIVIVNDKARVEYISKSFVEILGIEKQEYALNLPFIDLFPSVKFKLFFGKFLRREGTFQETFDVLLNGERRWFILRSAEIGESKIARLFECVEITPIVEARQAAEAATRSKSEFLAAMSHEIRTPMNAIIGITQIQLQNENLPKEYAVALEKINVSGNNLLGIINDILDLSKIETGKMELNPNEYDVPSFINDAVQLNIVRIGSKPIKFTLDISKNMPIKLFGDELRLKQILNNLLSNAIKYTEKGSVKLSVYHFPQDEDVMLRFAVTDTGQGMKPEDQEHLFSEYSRFNAKANRSTEGTGLGLYITKKLVEMMDGAVMVESEYGKGSMFIVGVRQKAVKCPEIGAEIAERLCNFTYSGDRQAAKLQINIEPMPYGSVLVVDDVETNLYVAEGLLSPYKLKIETANSGFAAIEKVQAGNTYDIIFMDHMMPKMDGIETTEKLRLLRYNGVILALTANALIGNDEMFSQHGFDGFIPKPIDIRHLNAALNKFIRDRYPEEAKKYKPQEPAETAVLTPAAMPMDETRAKLMRIFRGDAERAVVTLRETAPHGGGAGSDIKLFTTTAHAMKSALANIGRTEKSQQAAALEKAGLDGDTDFIAANTESFIKTLESLIMELSPAEPAVTDADVAEDTAYLKEQLQIIKSACENYDDTAAYAALDRLKEKPWKPQTAAALEKIHDMLFLHSDFNGAAEQAGEISGTL